MAKALKIDELNKLYTESKNLDKEATSEMRSNILLIEGTHYSKRTQEFGARMRDSSQSSNENYKLRITKNWIHRAHRMYVSSILSQAPGVTVSPRNPTEVQDQKSAELNQAVWQYAKEKYKIKALIRDLASDFCGIGECAVKIIFDPNKGRFVGYAPLMDEDGQPAVDMMGQQVPDEESPVFSGEFIFERVFGQNIFRDPSCRQMKDAYWIGVEKLENTDKLRERYEADPDKSKMIFESSEDFVVFDSNRGGYSKEKNQTLILEYYFKPCLKYPNGYFYITTKAGILEEGELPGGIFPFVWQGFDEHPTKPRATSFVKVARPWQAEINRASSQVALHQVTISEDKILYQAGTKVAQGALLPGVRGLTYQGAPPTILPGRTGEQYFNYIALQEQEMSRALMLDILDTEKTSNMDPMGLLYRSMNQSQKFAIYSDKFGEFLISLCETFLGLAKMYLDDEELIAAIGRAEYINVQEFKSSTPLNHAIKVEEQSDDIETKLGRQLVFNHILQYVGPQLSRDDIGKMIQEMPFGNWQESFSDLTVDYQNVKNDFLAIERGEQPQISSTDKSEYALAGVAKRMKERDFNLLSPQVKELYFAYQKFHEEKVAAEAEALKAAQSEFIPTGGAMIACDMYQPSGDPSKGPKRVRVPYQALDWLVSSLDRQGMTSDKMESMNQAQVAEISKMLLSGGGSPLPQIQNGQESPLGVMG